MGIALRSRRGCVFPSDYTGPGTSVWPLDGRIQRCLSLLVRSEADGRSCENNQDQTTALLLVPTGQYRDTAKQDAGDPRGGTNI